MLRKKVTRCIAAMLSMCLLFSCIQIIPVFAEEQSNEVVSTETIRTWDFSDAEQINDFELSKFWPNANSNNATQEHFKIVDGAFCASAEGNPGQYEGRFKKAILESVALDVKNVSVDIQATDGTTVLAGGIYLGYSEMVTQNATWRQDDCVFVSLKDEGVNDAKIQLEISRGRSDANGKQKVLYQKANINADNVLYSGNEAQPMRMSVDVAGPYILVTISLLSDETKYVQAVADVRLDKDGNATGYTSDVLKGRVGLGAWCEGALFDNFAVSVDTNPDERSWDFGKAEQIEDFELDKMYKANGSDNVKTEENFKIEDGYFCASPEGEPGQYEGRFKKAIVKSEERDVQSASVNIRPTSGTTVLAGGIYVGYADKVTASGTWRQDDCVFVSLKDEAANNTKIELTVSRGTSAAQTVLKTQTFNSDGAFYSSKDAQPMRLTVDVMGSYLLVTVNLLSDETKYIQTIVDVREDKDGNATGFTSDILKGRVGLGAWCEGALFDNLVVTLDTHTDSTWDYSSAEQINDFELAKFWPNANSNNATQEHFKIENGSFIASPEGNPGQYEGRFKKAILESTALDVKNVSVDIQATNGTTVLAGGIYLGYSEMVTQNATWRQDDCVFVSLKDEGVNDAKIQLEISRGRSDANGKQKVLYQNANINADNVLYSGNEAQPMRMSVDVAGPYILVTISLLSDETKYVQAVADVRLDKDGNATGYTSDILKGRVGLGAWCEGALFDNFAVSVDTKADERAWDYSDANQINDFDLDKMYKSNGSANVQTQENFKIEDGYFCASPEGEPGQYEGRFKKAIVKSEERNVQSVSVNIRPTNETTVLAGGIYIGYADKVTASGTWRQDDCVFVSLKDEGANNTKIELTVSRGTSAAQTVLKTQTFNSDGAFYSSKDAQPMRLTVDVMGSYLLVTVNLLSDETKYIQTIVDVREDKDGNATGFTSDILKGRVGLGAWCEGALFDNLQIEMVSVAAVDNQEPEQDQDQEQDQEPSQPEVFTPTKTYEFTSLEDALDFDFYRSTTSAGFNIQKGMLLQGGTAGERKAILRGINRSYETVSVDIYPGNKKTIDGGIYLGATDAGHAINEIHALAVLVESNKEDVNQIDIVIGEFNSGWTELKRITTNSANENALFTKGKQSVNLRVDVDGNTLTITLSLRNDPTIFVKEVYEYTGAINLQHGAAGLRSYATDNSFDNLQVVYTETAGNSSGAGSETSSGAGSGTIESVPTGDRNSAVLLWTTIMVLSLGGIAFLLYDSRKRIR